MERRTFICLKIVCLGNCLVNYVIYYRLNGLSPTTPVSLLLLSKEIPPL